jgi:predicted transcriptional regulator
MMDRDEAEPSGVNIEIDPEKFRELAEQSDRDYATARAMLENMGITFEIPAVEEDG